MHISRSRSLGLASALAVLALGSAAAIPAHAADATLKIEAPGSVAVDPSSTAPDHGSGSTAVQLHLTLSDHPAPAMGRVTVDLAPLQGIASVMPQSGCTIAGQVLTCDMQTMYDGKLDLRYYLYGPAAAREAGSSAVLHTTAVFDGRTATADTKVTLGGSNLTVKEVDTNRGLKPGDTWTPDLTVTNKGQLPASQLHFTFTGGMDLSFVPRFSNCEYGTSADGAVVICTVHSEVAAGETVHLDPIGFKVDSTAYYAYEDVRVTATAPAKDGWLGGYTFTPGPTGGPRLTVGKPETQGAPNGVIDFDRNNAAALEAVVPNTADFSVEGGWAPDQGSGLGELTVGMADNGPASIFWRSGSYPAIIRVTVPKAVKILNGSQPACRLNQQNQDPAVTVWDCTTNPYIRSGQHYWSFFTLDLDHNAGLSAKVTLPSIGEDGQDSGMPWDPNKSNNEVVIPLGTTMNTTRPTVPGGSASPGTPTPSSSASGSPAATPSTSPSTGATASPSTSASTSAVGGSLASTGADGLDTTATAGGAAILLGGGVLALANRRRKRGAHE
ncbi:hypothetical protein [Kitasatospora griseola]|uniref:hypothetical protein n=1 Tax=Kitasatospora griseola TaxID=2064 RepID=UPI0016711C66|nr:hypothetical protein [Kitasatospora griseola]GGQ63396.1 hypothetical protein GCM10010195_18780 [Kitasatospora griseola]